MLHQVFTVVIYDTCYATGMLIGMYSKCRMLCIKIFIRLSRSWKNHLCSVKDENKIQVYQALSVLIQETSLEVFTNLLDKFLCHWEEKEPDFVTYFREYYASRPGIQTCVLYMDKYTKY